MASAPMVAQTARPAGLQLVAQSFSGAASLSMPSTGVQPAAMAPALHPPAPQKASTTRIACRAHTLSPTMCRARVRSYLYRFAQGQSLLDFHTRPHKHGCTAARRRPAPPRPSGRARRVQRRHESHEHHARSARGRASCAAHGLARDAMPEERRCNQRRCNQCHTQARVMWLLRPCAKNCRFF